MMIQPMTIGEMLETFPAFRDCKVLEITYLQKPNRFRLMVTNDGVIDTASIPPGISEVRISSPEREKAAA